MTSKRNLILGFTLLALVAIGMAWFITPLIQDLGEELMPPIPTSISNEIYVYGGYRCFEDDECLALLRDKYDIEVRGEFRFGSFRMADDYQPEVDCIWPGSITVIDYFQTVQPDVKFRQWDVIFQTPIALFTWRDLIPELEKAGLVYAKEGVYFLRMQPLVDAMIAEEQWNDIGASIPGYVRVESTDPASSNSGTLWMEMIGNFLVPGDDRAGKVLTGAELQAHPEILEALYAYWENQGLQVDTTSNLFDKFVSSGTGMPMIVAYESSFIDWIEDKSDDLKAQADRIVGLYPENTINTDHTLVSLSPDCDPLVTAFASDTQLQELGWVKHGMRNASGGIGVKPQSAPWFAASVPTVPEAKVDVFQAIKDALKNGPPPVPHPSPTVSYP